MHQQFASDFVQQALTNARVMKGVPLRWVTDARERREWMEEYQREVAWEKWNRRDEWTLLKVLAEAAALKCPYDNPCSDESWDYRGEIGAELQAQFQEVRKYVAQLRGIIGIQRELRGRLLNEDGEDIILTERAELQRRGYLRKCMEEEDELRGQGDWDRFRRRFVKSYAVRRDRHEFENEEMLQLQWVEGEGEEAASPMGPRPHIGLLRGSCLDPRRGRRVIRVRTTTAYGPTPDVRPLEGPRLFRLSREEIAALPEYARRTQNAPVQERV